MQGQLLHFIWYEHTLWTCGTFNLTEYIANSRDTALNFPSLLEQDQNFSFFRSTLGKNLWKYKFRKRLQNRIVAISNMEQTSLFYLEGIVTWALTSRTFFIVIFVIFPIRNNINSSCHVRSLCYTSASVTVLLVMIQLMTKNITYHYHFGIFKCHLRWTKSPFDNHWKHLLIRGETTH